MSASPSVDAEFTRALPKAELHAHLSGSISTRILHDIWKDKRTQGQCLNLADPNTIIKPGTGFVDVSTFFPLFDTYIYSLLDREDVTAYATRRVIADFRDDGVAYLELRPTPRENYVTGMTWDSYVQTINKIAYEANADSRQLIEVKIILSIDRKMTAEQAMRVVDLAEKYRDDDHKTNHVVGLDLCGNPTRGNMATFEPAFKRARELGLGITIHFAEIPMSSSEHELDTILSWQPQRLGHVIHVPDRHKILIAERKLGLELCLTCNVLAKLTSGGFAAHHFREWYATKCPISLCTDDFGIFGSPSSREYLIAANHFQLDRSELIKLSREAVSTAFTGRDRMQALLDAFESTDAI